MIQGKKCSAYYSTWKNDIDKITANDLVFLYSNEVGVEERNVKEYLDFTKEMGKYLFVCYKL